MASTTDPSGSKPEDKSDTIRIAIEGCGHGTLNNIYASVAESCKAKSWSGIDLLIICGDFQATRNAQDLHAMAVPAKYREMLDFHEYYSGARIAPYLTIFVGGNHEASNHLFELYYGGWVAPNIYYMGAANVLRYGTMRIAGLSGIWKGFDYRKPHHERLPYSDDSVRSAYHVRELDVRKLLQIRTQVHVGLSHDWPQGIVWCGDWKNLFRRKAHLEQDARSGRLGSVAAKQVLERLRPRYWFSAHLHVRYEAFIKHNDDQKEESLQDATASTNDKPQNVKFNERKLLSASDIIDFDAWKRSDETQLDSTASTNDKLQSMKLNEGKLLSASDVIDTTNLGPAANSDEIQLDSTDAENEESSTPKDVKNNASNPGKARAVQDTAAARYLHELVLAHGPSDDEEDVPQGLRAQLPESFKPRLPEVDMPFPKDIQSEYTKFLALDKCLPGRDFLQFLEVPPPTQNTEPRSRPFKLEYDKEWLAITRVFAKELVLGQDSSHVPRNLGESSYRELIQKEEAWVEEQIVAKGSMVVPENFVVTAPVYDSSTGPRTTERPIEYSNPQTSQFCSMLQINNPFEMSEEEKARREAESVRISNEPPVPAQRGERGGRGHYQSRGGRGNHRGGRGRGRGRGRGH